jgi:hypothetical protein
LVGFFLVIYPRRSAGLNPRFEAEAAIMTSFLCSNICREAEAAIMSS